MLWLTPAMDRLFVEPASERRRFLDRLVLALAPAHGMHATRYDAAMRERNRLLASDGPSIPTTRWRRGWRAARDAVAAVALLLGIRHWPMPRSLEGEAVDP